VSQSSLFGPPQCSSCGAEIVWITAAKSGRPIPCDSPLVTVVTRGGEVVTGHVSHFATCPHADKHRQENKL